MHRTIKFIDEIVRQNCNKFFETNKHKKTFELLF